MLQWEINYQNGARDGQCREWFPTGGLKSEKFYTFNSRRGIWRSWYESGLMKEIVEYQDDELHGWWKEFDDNGALVVVHLYINNVALTGRIQNLIERNALKPRHLLKIHNRLVRRKCLEEIGYERILQDLPHDIIAKEGEYELARIDWHKDEEPIYLIKVKCPSTNVYYTLRVPPQMRTIQQAVAWTFGLTEKNYQPDEET